MDALYLSALRRDPTFKEPWFQKKIYAVLEDARPEFQKLAHNAAVFEVLDWDDSTNNTELTKSIEVEYSHSYILPTTDTTIIEVTLTAPKEVEGLMGVKIPLRLVSALIASLMKKKFPQAQFDPHRFVDLCKKKFDVGQELARIVGQALAGFDISTAEGWSNDELEDTFSVMEVTSSHGRYEGSLYEDVSVTYSKILLGKEKYGSNAGEAIKLGVPFQAFPVYKFTPDVDAFIDVGASVAEEEAWARYDSNLER